MKYNYQKNFSKKNGRMYLVSKRKRKAQKIIAVLKDFYKNKTKKLIVLDVGSSTGIMDHYLSPNFKKIIGIDIDKTAVKNAQNKYQNKKTEFLYGDAMKIPFKKNFFDLVVCTQVYEHVPDSQKLINEIYRVLKPGGICFFAAGNRFVLMEEHYNLPLLSVFPKKIANIYLKLFRNINFYYENHLSVWGLKKLVSSFKIIDYTPKIIKNPKKFFATEMLQPNTLKHKAIIFLMPFFYWLIPDYIWLLKKPN